ncbi:capsid cement protein [Phreatobacter stygius]|uniref:DUF2190 family protein n=1 Tax=Phreatobacter stygius TaxID=1940610 RepID=A0A4D7B7K9_9HYPH|nr:capsid cement protein [Phreatobacter stygius]QCI65636.1 DUF2190 family protein [Phreatobacter stygius]
MHTQTFTHTFTATGSGVQRRFVNFAGAQAGAADPVLGVAMTDFAAGQPTAAHVLGVAAVESGAAVALGDGVTPDAQGRAVTDPTAAGAVAPNRVGRALNAVTAAGQTLFILIR